MGVIQNWMMQNGSIPKYLTNCILYYDKNLSHVTDTGIMTVVDKSGVYGNMTQSDAGYKPTFNTSTGLYFTGGRLLLSPRWVYSDEFTIYFKLNRATAGDTRLFGYSVTTGNANTYYRFFMLMRSTSILISFGSNNFSFTGLTTDQLSGNHLYKIDRTLTSTGIVTTRLYIDGVLITSSTSTAYGGYYCIDTLGSIDTSQTLYGYLAQLMIFNIKLDDPSSAIVESQLSIQHSIPTWNKVVKRVIWQTGQSNAEGRVALSGFPVQNQNFSNAHITNTLYPTTIRTIDLPVGASNYRSFEAEYARLINNDIYVFKYAQGGTKLAYRTTEYTWNLGQITNYSLWFMAKMYYSFYTNLMKSLGINPSIICTVRMQGESDAEIEADSLAFNTNLTDLINDMRTFLDATVPHIEMLINYPGAAYRTNVRSAQTSVCSTLSNCHTIETSGYSMQDGNLHYSANGLITGGTDIYNMCIANNWL